MEEFAVSADVIVGLLNGLSLGERLIIERTGIGGRMMMRIEKPTDVPVLGATPVPDELAHLSPADRESARRLNEALVDDEGRETPAAGRYITDWNWPKLR